MFVYTRKNIIMDQRDLRLKEAIGKTVYCSSDIHQLLKNANENKYEMTLVHIAEESDVKPFTVRDTNGDEFKVDFIIIKKELEYKPFYNAEELISAYLQGALAKPGESSTPNFGTIWIKDKDVDGVFYMVTEIWRDGVVLGSDQATTKWDELLDGYTFPDGSPCGNLIEVEQEGNWDESM